MRGATGHKLGFTTCSYLTPPNPTLSLAEIWRGTRWMWELGALLLVPLLHILGTWLSMAALILWKDIENMEGPTTLAVVGSLLILPYNMAELGGCQQ